MMIFRARISAARSSKVARIHAEMVWPVTLAASEKATRSLSLTRSLSTFCIFRLATALIVATRPRETAYNVARVRGPNQAFGFFLYRFTGTVTASSSVQPALRRP